MHYVNKSEYSYSKIWYQCVARNGYIGIFGCYGIMKMFLRGPIRVVFFKKKTETWFSGQKNVSKSSGAPKFIKLLLFSREN